MSPLNQPLRGRARLAPAVPGTSAEARSLAEHAAAVGRLERAIPLEHTIVATFDGRGAGLAPSLVTGRNAGLMAAWDALGSFTLTLGAAGLWLDAWAHVIGSSGKSATVRAFDAGAGTVSILCWTLLGAAADILVGERLIVSVHELRSLE